MPRLILYGDESASKATPTLRMGSGALPTARAKDELGVLDSHRLGSLQASVGCFLAFSTFSCKGKGGIGRMAFRLFSALPAKIHQALISPKPSFPAAGSVQQSFLKMFVTIAAVFAVLSSWPSQPSVHTSHAHTAHTGLSPLASRALAVVAAHPIVQKNPYCSWFASGQANALRATHPQLRRTLGMLRHCPY